MTRRSISKRAAVVTATALVTLGTVGTIAATAGPEHAAKPTKTQIAGLFDTWNKALQTGDSDKVADLYARDATLLPTVSNEVRTDRAGIVDYFDHFLANKPVGTKIETIVNVLDSNSAIDTGVYEFTLTDHDTGRKRVVEARYTYTYEKIDGKWKIVNHHSSVMPEKK
ncbi:MULTISPECIES: SgcJ/EcaC family oxidoreductase [unclassified Streptomyces]|uniref:SgcJ/EcaC family oxidoreductase n=1 Tax=unclassified Streptomyces TaxID=2593676 RepID=UPI00225A78B8|nr:MULTISPECIES: SgcJ/EcaC family oxidoreductase [unclassified Streptomyces]MCX4882437.1 SgcJ/EcaC family oxidoreductase [Streptomyces sp. NBC_00847]MCX5422466.1 SgcJ/EcaC family oxidoreductase [Streptomyces sp. NBC_00078]